MTRPRTITGRRIHYPGIEKPLKLFRAEFRVVIFLAAENMKEAREEAPGYADEEIRQVEPKTVFRALKIRQITKPQQIDAGWRRALVYQPDDGDNFTGRAILKLAEG